jgi:hypothetical protein
MPAWNVLLPAAGWMLALAWSPWWLGLPLLLALALILLLLQPRLAALHTRRMRLALRWGLPCALFALQRGLGGDVLAWGAALLGALAGYTLLAGLEAWLERDRRRLPPVQHGAEWPELAMAPVGPAAEIIELQLPHWQGATGSYVDPRGGPVDYRQGEYRLADGGAVLAGAQACFSPSGRWFVARMADDRGIVLWDRERQWRRRLGGWQLCGWYRGQPWLSRQADDMPLPLDAVLNRGDEDA